MEKPKGSMFVWAPIPEQFRHLGSLEFSKLLLEKALVAVSPGIGFGPLGEGFVRFALIENDQRTRQAIAIDQAFFETVTRFVSLSTLLLTPDWRSRRNLLTSGDRYRQACGRCRRSFLLARPEPATSRLCREPFRRPEFRLVFQLVFQLVFR